MKRAVIHPEAEAERLAAAAYIENSRDGYGMLFLDVYEKLRDTIRENPALFPKKRNGVQFCYMGMFRYNIIYLNREDDVVILAVAHTSRKPGYWKMRFLDAIKGVI